MAKREKKLRMVKKGEGGGVPTPVSKLDDTELGLLSTGNYKVFTNGAEDRDLKGKYIAVNIDHILSVFPLEDQTVLFSASGNSWTVAEDFATVLKRLNANI